MPVYRLLKLITSNKLRTQQASTGTRSESPRDVEIVDHSPSLLLRVPSSGSVSHSLCVALSSPSVSHTPSSLLSPRPDPFFVSPPLVFVTVRSHPAPSSSASLVCYTPNSATKGQGERKTTKDQSRPQAQAFPQAQHQAAREGLEEAGQECNI